MTLRETRRPGAEICLQVPLKGEKSGEESEHSGYDRDDICLRWSVLGFLSQCGNVCLNRSNAIADAVHLAAHAVHLAAHGVHMTGQGSELAGHRGQLAGHGSQLGCDGGQLGVHLGELVVDTVAELAHVSFEFVNILLNMRDGGLEPCDPCVHSIIPAASSGRGQGHDALWCRQFSFWFHAPLPH